jgi:hypothetical protein
MIRQDQNRALGPFFTDLTDKGGPRRGAGARSIGETADTPHTARHPSVMASSGW